MSLSTVAGRSSVGTGRQDGGRHESVPPGAAPRDGRAAERTPRASTLVASRLRTDRSDRADGDPVQINLNSAMYGSPDEIARMIEALRGAGAGYLLLNGGGSGGGEKGRRSLQRFAREVMPAFVKT